MGLLEKGEKKEAEIVEIPGVKYETVLDRIYYEVKRAKGVKIKDLGRRLDLSYEEVEKFAKVLDEQGLAKLYYPSIGSPKLIKEDTVVGKSKKGKARNLVLFVVLLIIIVSAVIYYLTYAKII